MRAAAKLGCLSGLAALRREHLLAQMMADPIALPSLEQLVQLFNYREETGELVWKVNRTGGTKAGDVAGYISSLGYRVVKVKGRLYMAHRLIWKIRHGEIPEEAQIDHINGSKSDNRLENLRLCSGSNNCQNRAASSRNKSGYKGVYWWKARQAWRADIVAKGVHHYLGTFATAELAHMAYAKAAAELHGDFARAA
jgi:hypothetical protein